MKIDATFIAERLWLRKKKISLPCYNKKLKKVSIMFSQNIKRVSD